MRTTLVSRAIPALLFVMVASCAGGRLVAPRTVDPLTIGDLQYPVATMTGDQLWSAIDTLGWIHGPKQDRDCARGRCKGRIDVVAGQQPPGATRISPNGTIVARFVNRGSPVMGWDEGAENKYGFEKSTTSAYLLIAIPNSSVPDGWSWIVREARAGNTSTTPMRDGSWVTCRADENNPHHPSPTTKSEFYRCNPGPNGNGNGSAVRMLYMRDDPGWLDCEQGCCSAGQ